jgi:hypothetical protein
MNLLQAAESMVRAKMDEQGFIMNSCLHDQKTENLDRFLSALETYQGFVAQYEVIQGLRSQVPGTTPEEVLDEPSNEDR